MHLFQLRQGRYLLALALFACLATPIWLYDYVPLVDFPNHLARIEILASYDQDLYLQKTYSIDRRPLPNLAMDLTVPILRRYLSLEDSGKFFLTALLGLFCISTVLLARMLHGRLTLRAMLLWPTFYNSALLWGFVNYIAGVCAFVAWSALFIHVTSDGARRPRILGYFLLAFGAVVCYLAHLTAFAMCCVVWALSVARAMANDRRIGTPLLLCGAALLPSMALYSYLLSTANFGAQPHLSAITYDWPAKVIQLTFFTRGYQWHRDILPTLLGIGALGYCIGRSRWRAWVPRAMWPAIVFIVAFIVLPKGVNETTGSGFDERFVWPAAIFLVLALPTNGWSSREKITVAAVCLLAWSIRLEEVRAGWKSLSGETVQMLTVLKQVPEHASVYPIWQTRKGLDEGKRDSALCHVVEYIVAKQKAFDPILFAVPGAQPVLFRSSPANFDIQSVDALGGYDYVWSFNPSEKLARYLAANADPIGDTGGFVLWRLRK